jgi:hypothetical protein
MINPTNPSFKHFRITHPHFGISNTTSKDTDDQSRDIIHVIANDRRRAIHEGVDYEIYRRRKLTYSRAVTTALRSVMSNSTNASNPMALVVRMGENDEATCQQLGKPLTSRSISHNINASTNANRNVNGLRGSVGNPSYVSSARR